MKIRSKFCLVNIFFSLFSFTIAAYGELKDSIMLKIDSTGFVHINQLVLTKNYGLEYKDSLSVNLAEEFKLKKKNFRSNILSKCDKYRFKKIGIEMIDFTTYKGQSNHTLALDIGIKGYRTSFRYGNRFKGKIFLDDKLVQRGMTETEFVKLLDNKYKVRIESDPEFGTHNYIITLKNNMEVSFEFSFEFLLGNLMIYPGQSTYCYYYFTDIYR